MCFWNTFLFWIFAKSQRLQETNDAPAFDSLDAEGPGGAEGIFLAAGASGSPGQFSRLRILRKGRPILGATTYCYYLLGRLNFRYLGEFVSTWYYQLMEDILLTSSILAYCKSHHLYPIEAAKWISLNWSKLHRFKHLQDIGNFSWFKWLKLPWTSPKLSD